MSFPSSSIVFLTISTFTFHPVSLGVSSGPTPSWARASLQQWGHTLMLSCKMLSACLRADCVLTPPAPRKQTDAGRGLHASFMAGRSPGECWGSGKISVLLQPLSSTMAENHHPVPVPSCCQPQPWSHVGKSSLCSGIFHAWKQSATYSPACKLPKIKTRDNWPLITCLGGGILTI